MARTLRIRAWIVAMAIGCVIALTGSPTKADLEHVKAVDGKAMANKDLLDNAVDAFRRAAARWTGAAQKAAEQIFWSLAVISLVWTAIQLMLRQAELGEIAREAVQFMLFTGFWAWMMRNAPQHARQIMTGMVELGQRMAGGTVAHSPSTILDAGFEVLNRTLEASEWYESPIVFLLGMVVVCVLAIVAANMVQVLVAGWLVAYGGIVVLGFGGAKWTNDIAINYYRTCLGFGLTALSTILLVGVGESFMTSLVNGMSPTVTAHEVAVVLAGAVILAFLVNKVPSQIGALASGGGLHHAMAPPLSGMLPLSVAYNMGLGALANMAMEQKMGSFFGKTDHDPQSPGGGSPAGGGNGPDGGPGGSPPKGSAFGPLGPEPTIDRGDDKRAHGIAFGEDASPAVNLEDKLQALSDQKTAVAFSPDEAQLAGAFVEDALDEADALESRGIDLPPPQSDVDEHDKEAAPEGPGEDGLAQPAVAEEGGAAEQVDSTTNTPQRDPDGLQASPDQPPSSSPDRPSPSPQQAQKANTAPTGAAGATPDEARAAPPATVEHALPTAVAAAQPPSQASPHTEPSSAALPAPPQGQPSTPEISRPSVQQQPVHAAAPASPAFETAPPATPATPPGASSPIPTPPPSPASSPLPRQPAASDTAPDAASTEEGGTRDHRPPQPLSAEALRAEIEAFRDRK